MGTKRITVQLFGTSKELEFKPHSTFGYESVEACVLVRNVTGKTVRRSTLRLNSREEILSPVFNNRQALHVGWSVDYETISPGPGQNLRIVGPADKTKGE